MEKYLGGFLCLLVKPPCNLDTTQVIELTDEFEGSVIRVFRRLEELLRQLSQVRRQ